MKECHKCKHNGQGSSACLKCYGGEDYSYPYTAYILDTYDPVQPDTKGSDYVTSLDPDTEDKLRKILTMLTDLTPNELLLIQSICKGDSLVEYARKMEAMAKSNISFSRFRAFQTRKSIVGKLGDDFAKALLTKGQKKAIKK